MPKVLCGLDYDKLPVRVDCLRTHGGPCRVVCGECCRAEDLCCGDGGRYADHPISYASSGRDDDGTWHLVVADEPRKLSLHERVARLPEWLLASVLTGIAERWWVSPEGWDYYVRQDMTSLYAYPPPLFTEVAIVVAQEPGFDNFSERRLRILEAVAAHWRSVLAGAWVDHDTDEWPVKP